MAESRQGRTLLVALGAAAAVAAGTAATPGGTAGGTPGSHAAGGTIVTVAGAPVVPGSYIAVLTDPAASAAGLVARYGGSLRRVWSTAPHGFNALMTADQARRLAADPAVAYVQADAVVRLAATQPDPPSYGLDRL